MKTKSNQPLAESLILSSKTKTYPTWSCKKSGHGNGYAAGLLRSLVPTYLRLRSTTPSLETARKTSYVLPPKKQGVFEMKLVTHNLLAGITLYYRLWYLPLAV